MDKIYSRHRIKLIYFTRKSFQKKIVILMIIIIAIMTVSTLIKSIDPIFENLCRDRAIQLATLILNEEASKVLKKYDYKEIVSITKTEGNNILKTDVKTINDIASDLAAQITNRLQEQSSNKIEIPLGGLSGNKYLSGIGPPISIKIIPSGEAQTELKTEFESKGINQTVYRIYLEIECNQKIITSYRSINSKVINQILLVETVVVGNVPETYYNLEGLDKENNIDIIE